VGNRGWKLASLGKTGAEETGDLLYEGVRGDEGVVLAGELLDELLVLVEFLQVVRRHGIDAVVFGAIDVMLVTEDTDAHARSWDTGQLDGTRETLVTLRIIVLETDLKLDRLEEVSLLLVGGVLEKLLHVLAHSGDCDF